MNDEARLTSAIAHAKKVAAECEANGAEPRAQEQRELADWLRELQQARLRLQPLVHLTEGVHPLCGKVQIETVRDKLRVLRPSLTCPECVVRSAQMPDGRTVLIVALTHKGLP